MKLREIYFNPPRGVSQPEITRAYIELERTGFCLDVPYLNQQAEKAREDESKQLTELEHNLRSVVGDSYLAERTVDKIWSSGPQLDDLFHTVLGLEPSPIWKKGEVRNGERKCDGVALEYLAAANPEYRPILGGIVNLRRIRGCLKYLAKLPNYVWEDGLVHPVYGSPSDSDERSGAKSGRSTMKSPEGQQIPNSEEKDPYQIRKGFIAPPGQVLVVRDYAAMEAVLLHCICLALFQDDSLASANSSIFHAENASLVFGKYLNWKHPISGRPVSEYSLADFKTDDWLIDRRRDAKTIFYGLQFCKSVRGFGFTLLDENGQPIGQNKAQVIVDAFNEVRPGLKKWQDFCWDYLWKTSRMAGFKPGIATFSGRWREVSRLVEESVSRGKADWQFRKAWRQICNHPEQGGGADIKCAALVKLQAEFARTGIGRVQNDIHDELISRCNPGDVEEVLAIKKEKMENTYPLPCGVKLSTSGGSGVNWYEAK